MAKQEADNLKKISIFWLKKQKLMEPHCWNNTGIQWTNGMSGNKSSIGIHVSLFDDDKSLRLLYTTTQPDGQKKDFDYKVPIVSTLCRYGGKRYWFICPLSVNGKYCGRRVAILYKGNGYFGCRHCFNLTYETKNENRHSKIYPSLVSLEANFKAEAIEKTIKRQSYRGQPTKKQRKIERIFQRARPYIRTVLNS